MVINKKCSDHLQSKWELKKQVEEEFCINVKNFLWLPGTHLVNLEMMLITMRMMVVVKMMLDRVMLVDMMGAILKIILLKHNINGCHPSFEDIVAGIVTGVNCSIPHLLNVDRN